MRPPLFRGPKPPKGYRLFTSEEECSMFTPGSYWSCGCDCYFYTVRIFVPARLKDENVWDWIDRHGNDENGLLWVNDDGSCPNLKPLK